MGRRAGARGTSADSLLLALVKVLTLGVGIASTMILSHALTLRAYGTYSQASLVVALCADATVLGLADAANYFFNRDGRLGAGAGRYVNAAFTMQLAAGAVAAMAILGAQSAIIDHFDNPSLRAVLVYAAFRPMLANMASILQVLVVSVGKARAIAARNAAFSLLKLLAVLLTAHVTSDVATLFALLLALDALSVAWFWAVFRRSAFAVRPVVMSRRIAGEILSFSVPMALYVLSTTLTRQTGALVIGANETTEAYAIYANCATILPLDVVSASFLTVMIPLMTRYVGTRDFARARELFGRYLEMGYLTTVTFSMACLVAAPELVRVLYGERYLPGLTVFCLYLVSGMVRFANLSLVLSAAGRSRVLMAVSATGLLVNAGACLLAYRALGFVGPALATVVVYAATMAVLLSLSLREIRGHLRDVLDLRRLALYCASVVGAALVATCAKGLLGAVGAPWWLGASVAALLVAGVTLAANRTPLLRCLRAIDSMR